MPDDPAPLTPPGTTATTFWQSSGAKIALVTTVGFVLSIAKGLILTTPIPREAIANGVEMLSWAWLGAFGLQRVDTSSLRWK